ncbi:MFS transporter, partial [Staphylococcus hominis]
IVINIISILLAVIVLFGLFKFEAQIKQPFLPIVEFNRSITLVFITDFVIALSLMGYNLYIPIYLQDHLGLSPLQSGFIIFPLSVAWIILNFNLAKIENLCSRKMLYIGAFTVLLVASIIIYLNLDLPLL